MIKKIFFLFFLSCKTHAVTFFDEEFVSWDEKAVGKAIFSVFGTEVIREVKDVASLQKIISENSEVKNFVFKYSAIGEDVQFKDSLEEALIEDQREISILFLKIPPEENSWSFPKCLPLATESFTELFKNLLSYLSSGEETLKKEK